MIVFGGSFIGLMLLPVDFPYWAFAVLIAANGIGGGLQRHGVPHGIAYHVGTLPPVSSLFAAVLGVNPLQHLLAASRVLSALPAAAQQTITGREFFPDLISGPFHHGLVVVFAAAACLAGLAAVASLSRGSRYVDPAVTAELPLPGARSPEGGGSRRLSRARRASLEFGPGSPCSATARLPHPVRR